MIPASLLPEAYRQQWCVAGGWAACPALAQDMDVWVYRVPTANLDTVRSELLAHIVAENAKATSYYKRPFYVEEQTEARGVDCHDQYEGVNVQIRKVARVEVKRESTRYLKDRKEIHLLVTDASSPGEILHGFDVSTHAVAIDWNGLVWKASGYTAPHVAPVELMHNEKTPERMRKIAARFGHPAPHDIADAVIPALDL